MGTAQGIGVGIVMRVTSTHTGETGTSMSPMQVKGWKMIINF
jgi:hypothetical protein